MTLAGIQVWLWVKGRKVMLFIARLCQVVPLGQVTLVRYARIGFRDSTAIGLGLGLGLGWGSEPRLQ